MTGPAQFLFLLGQLALEALKIYRKKREAKGSKLTPAERKEINATVVQAVKETSIEPKKLED